jgi:hypothetical protein
LSGTGSRSEREISKPCAHYEIQFPSGRLNAAAEFSRYAEERTETVDQSKSNARLFAVWSLALFVVGLLGYFILLAFIPFELAVGFLVSAELLALVFGIIGWSEKPGKVAVIGVSILII